MGFPQRAVAVALAAVLTAGAAACAASPPAAAKAAAQKSAEAWLALVDQGQYAGSWEQAAALFRAAVTRDAWESAVRGVRGPLGAVRSRKLRSADYRTSLPGAPDGQYVVIQYDTAFENKAAAVETVTPMLDKDGTWRVSGYFVR